MLCLCPLCQDHDHDHLYGRRGMSKRQSRDLAFINLLNISVTLSPLLSVDTRQFQTSMRDGTEAFWLSRPSSSQGKPVSIVCCLAPMSYVAYTPG